MNSIFFIPYSHSFFRMDFHCICPSSVCTLIQKRSLRMPKRRILEARPQSSQRFLNATETLFSGLFAAIQNETRWIVHRSRNILATIGSEIAYAYLQRTRPIRRSGNH
jgi:hypothetical protein